MKKLLLLFGLLALNSWTSACDYDDIESSSAAAKADESVDMEIGHLPSCQMLVSPGAGHIGRLYYSSEDHLFVVVTRDGQPVCMDTLRDATKSLERIGARAFLDEAQTAPLPTSFDKVEVILADDPIPVFKPAQLVSPNPPKPINPSNQ